MKKTLAAFFLALALLTGGAAAFSDVDEGLYYAAPIAWAVERGITTGTSETTFSPDALCTQGQILTFLWRAAGSPQVEAEIQEAASINPDFAKAIGWAIERNIFTGGSTITSGAILFDPAAPCTRGVAMNFLWRYAGFPASSAPGVFTDVSPNAGYAQAVAWAVEQGITSGTSETTFSPDEPCTRGQIATFLYRCLNETGEKVALPEDLEPQDAGQEEPARPLRSYTGMGRAYSLGLDGSEFTSEGVYEAAATVEIYSSQEAVFTVKVPFPLFQACSYTFRFENPEEPGEGYLFSFRRWDEAFDDMIPWEGAQHSASFVDMSGRDGGYTINYELVEEGRIDGLLVQRLSFSEDSYFSFDMLDGYVLSCEVNSNL